MRSIAPRHRLAGLLGGLALLGLTTGVAAGVAVGGGATHADARIVDGSGQTVGWARLAEDAAGQLHLNVQVEGLAAGRHGIHLHAIGQCVGPAFASAGGHHNPLGAEHGLDNPAGVPRRRSAEPRGQRRGSRPPRCGQPPRDSVGWARIVARRRWLGDRHPRQRRRPGHESDGQQRRPDRLRRDRSAMRRTDMERGIA